MHKSDVSFNKDHVKTLSQEAFIDRFSNIYPDLNLGEIYDEITGQKGHDLGFGVNKKSRGKKKTSPALKQQNDNSRIETEGSETENAGSGS